MTPINFTVERHLRDAGRGDAAACYELGLTYWSGTDGVEADLLEAHKFFNLAAAWGDERGSDARADVSDEMTAREIAEAQRRARAWLAGASRRVA